MDHYFRFWYAFAFPNFSDLEAGDVEGAYKYAVEPLLHQFAAFTFEEVCKRFVQELKKANALPFRYAKMGRWNGKTTVRDTSQESGMRMAETEIDILAVSKSGKDYLIGECKFKNSPFRYSEYLDMMVKLTPQKDKAAFYYALFSESGFDSHIMEEAKKNENIALYSLDQIVNLENG